MLGTTFCNPRRFPRRDRQCRFSKRPIVKVTARCRKLAQLYNDSRFRRTTMLRAVILHASRPHAEMYPPCICSPSSTEYYILPELYVVHPFTVPLFLRSSNAVTNFSCTICTRLYAYNLANLSFQAGARLYHVSSPKQPVHDFRASHVSLPPL